MILFFYELCHFTDAAHKPILDLLDFLLLNICGECLFISCLFRLVIMENIMHYTSL
jgi:hypothetical protein